MSGVCGRVCVCVCVCPVSHVDELFIVLCVDVSCSSSAEESDVDDNGEGGPTRAMDEDRIAFAAVSPTVHYLFRAAWIVVRVCPRFWSFALPRRIASTLPNQTVSYHPLVR